MPPYGTGKTHGWSRIIRFFVSPISEALHSLLISRHTNDANFLNLFDTQARHYITHRPIFLYGACLLVFVFLQSSGVF